MATSWPREHQTCGNQTACAAISIQWSLFWSPQLTELEERVSQSHIWSLGHLTSKMHLCPMAPPPSQELKAEKVRMNNIALLAAPVAPQATVFLTSTVVGVRSQLD